MLQFQEFQSPSKAYREIALWSWNDLLTPEELTRQIDLMDKGGWGGFVMHARAGLVTPYMGEDWMAMVRHCIAEAEQRGMQAWLYDEDKWPSGYAGGLASAAYPEYRAQYLVCNVENRPVLMKERIATFTAKRSNNTFVEVTPNSLPSPLNPDTWIMQFYPVQLAPGQLPFTAFTYGDLLNPAAVRSFLDTTYEAYAAQFQAHFGGTIPAIFTDEPCFQMHPVFSAGGKLEIPWTSDLPTYFASQNGYDLLAHLPSLFFEVGDFLKIRFDFWRTVTQRFVESYTQQISIWCHEHNIAYAGHYMGEDNLLAQIQWCGAAMPHYAHMDVPGIDKLGRQINTDAGTILTVKQLDSVASQLGKSRTLCELYGVSGQDFALRGRKWIGDWAYVLGVNLSDPHLALYSMRGERKRDCPPNLFFQQPWWDDNPLIADYMARLSYALSQGQRVVDVLVISPIASAWSVYSPASTWNVSRLDEAITNLCTALLEMRRDFHFADEMLIAPGALAEAQVVTGADGALVKVGKMQYRTIIVPPGITLSQHTVSLLRHFADAGGTVLALEPVPARIDGLATDAEVVPPQTQRLKLDDLAHILDAVLPKGIQIEGYPGIWMHQRRVGECDVYFLANIDQTQSGTVRARIPGAGRWEIWDARTGTSNPLLVETQSGTSYLSLDFQPQGSLLLMNWAHAQAHTSERREATVSHRLNLKNEWQIAFADDNALVIDRAQVQLGTGYWSEAMPILDICASLARGELSEHTPIFWGGDNLPFSLRYSFTVLSVPTNPLYLILETPEQFAIKVNGKRLRPAPDGWWIDPSFHKFDISDYILGGLNEIELSGHYQTGMELENIHLVGQFGVQGQFERRERDQAGQEFERYGAAFAITRMPNVICIAPVPTSLTTDLTAQGLPGTGAHNHSSRVINLTAQGFPFFAGRIRLAQRISLLRHADEHHVVAIDCPYASSIRVYMNGEYAGSAGWEPYEFDVTQLVKDGENLLEVELASSLRNLMGPHHLAGGDREWTANEHYRLKSRWTDAYILVPFGFDAVSVVQLRVGNDEI